MVVIQQNLECATDLKGCSKIFLVKAICVYFTEMNESQMKKILAILTNQMIWSFIL